MEVDQLQSNKFLNMFTVGALTIVGERLHAVSLHRPASPQKFRLGAMNRDSYNVLCALSLSLNAIKLSELATITY